MNTPLHHIILLLALLCLVPSPSTAQETNNNAARKYVKQGNRQFRKRDYSGAEVAYRKAYEQNKNNPQALYNLGTALMAQHQDTMAIKFFEQAASKETNPLRRSQSHYNLGHILQGRKMYGDAIEQYKQALRLNPADDDARYNLAVCKRQKDNGDDNNGSSKPDPKKEDEQNSQQDKDEKGKQDKPKEQQQNQPQMSKENAEQLLKAALQAEKQTQERLKQNQKMSPRRQAEKNW